MLYPWLKALHVAAVMTWMAGMVAAPAILARAPGRDAAAAMRWHFVRVTTPAMILALALGLWLAQDGGWFRAGWMHAKLVLVAILTGLHGVLSGQLRRRAAGAGQSVTPWIGGLSAVAVAAILAIACLVILKPGLR